MGWGDRGKGRPADPKRMAVAGGTGRGRQEANGQEGSAQGGEKRTREDPGGGRGTAGCGAPHAHPSPVVFQQRRRQRRRRLLCLPGPRWGDAGVRSGGVSPHPCLQQPRPPPGMAQPGRKPSTFPRLPSGGGSSSSSNLRRGGRAGGGQASSPRRAGAGLWRRQGKRLLATRAKEPRNRGITSLPAREKDSYRSC